MKIQVKQDKKDEYISDDVITREQNGVSNHGNNQVNACAYDNEGCQDNNINNFRTQNASEKVKDVTNNELILSKLESVLAKIHLNEVGETIKDEWVIVARTIDFCLLIFFSLIYIVTLVGWMLCSPDYVD